MEPPLVLGEGKALTSGHVTTPMKVLWETDSLAGMSPADAVSVHVVHLGNRLLEQPGKAAERILMTELPRMFPTVEFDEVTLGKLPMFFASVVHIWQRFNDVSTEEVGGGLTARTTRAACTVCDLFVQVCRLISGLDFA